MQTHLDTVMGRLTEEQRDLGARVFELLFTTSKNKTAYTVRELADAAGVERHALAVVLEALSSGPERILRQIAALPQDPDEPRYEICHDRIAATVLEWWTRYLKEREVRQAQRQHVEREHVTHMEAPAEPNALGRPGGSRGPRASYMIIAEALRQGRVVVIVGDGVSAATRRSGESWYPGCSFSPTTAELTQLLATEVGYPLDDAKGARLAEVASYYVAVADHHLLDERLHDIFITATEPAISHRFLARVAREAPLVIVTTTYDTLTERAFDAEHVEYDLFVNDIRNRRKRRSARDVKWDRSAGRSYICKIFGSVSLNREIENFVVTEEDEMELFGQVIAGRLPADLRAAFRDFHALFLDMSLQNWTQRLLLTRLRGVPPGENQGWAVVRSLSMLDARRWADGLVDVFEGDIGHFTSTLQEAFNRSR